MHQPEHSDRYLRGLRNLERIDGEAGQKVVASLQDIAPDLARYVIEYPFGDVYDRPALGLREREMVTVAALGALGNAHPQLMVHFHGALNVGVTPEELVELCIQLSVYAGFPAALNAIAVLRDTLQERKEAADETCT